MMRWEGLREEYGRERSRGNDGRTRFIRGLSNINGEKTVL